MTSAAQDFVDLVVRLVAGSSDDDWLVLSITESVVLDEQAVFAGPGLDSGMGSGRIIGVALDVERFLSLFSGYVGVAAEAFVIELAEPGWVKGDLPSPAAQDWAAARHRDVWWPALEPPAGERGR